MSDDLYNNAVRHRFELNVDGHTAFVSYRLAPGVITFVHTEVPSALSGRGIGSRLVRGVLDYARSQKLKVVPQCPFVAAYIGKHPEFSDLIA